MTDLATLSARDMRRLVAAREASPVEITRAVLDRIARWNPKLNAFVVLDAERAMEAAREAERAAMAGDDLARCTACR
jgi:aspartyl-tRNA(Asn)/glutamyl-tRNA(Gln) amidotransferase subunit A